jgi:sugar phosphate isomerase/epimerase
MASTSAQTQCTMTPSAMTPCNRRTWMQGIASVAVAAALPRTASFAEPAVAAAAAAEDGKGAQIRFGLVTYQWGKDWDLPTLLSNCAAAGALGVELRTTHRHGVEPGLDDAARAAVRQQFADSPVELVGLGSDERFDNPDPAVVRKAIERTKEFVVLSHDVGGSGVKVKPDRFWPDVPREQTIAQIAKSLQELGEYAEGFGQQIRLEVHGQCAELPTIRAILDIADHPSVVICWNSNPQDLQGAGLKANFHLVRDRMGTTSHVHLVDGKAYPFADLLDLFVETDYHGWLLLEEGQVPADPAAELARQRELFDAALKVSRAKFASR